MNKTELTQYKETLDRINNFMKSEGDLMKIFGDKTSVIRRAFEIMEDNMEALAKNKKITASEEEKSIVKEAVNLFLAVAVECPIIPPFRDLSKDYLLFAFNWNRELGKRPDIDVAIKAVKAIVEAQLTFFDTINLMRTLMARTKEKERFNPPAFELSRHYLESLRGETKNKKELNRSFKKEKLSKKNNIKSINLSEIDKC